MRRISVFLPVWLALVFTGCRGSAIEGAPEELLVTGRDLFAKQEYSQARRHYHGIRKYHPEALEAEEALLGMARCDLKLKQGEDSFESLKKLVNDYPNTRFAVDIADSEFELGTMFLDGKMPGFLFFAPARGLGVDVLEHLQIHFRHHRLADDALIRVASYQISTDRHAEAVDTLRRLLADYPRSEHTLRARFELGQALLAQSRGPLYDIRRLQDARGAFADFIATTEQAGQVERHAKQIAAAKERLELIRNRLAERQYEIGRFYERVDSPRSAAHHYELCLRDFDGTPAAKKSRERLASLRTETETRQPEPAPKVPEKKTG